MLIVIKMMKGHWDLTHDTVVPGELNDPDCLGTWDEDGGENDNPVPMASVNGSEFLTMDEVGRVIRAMVLLTREYGGLPYEYVELGTGREGGLV